MKLECNPFSCTDKKILKNVKKQAVCLLSITYYYYIILTPKDETKGRPPMAVPGNFAVI